MFCHQKCFHIEWKIDPNKAYKLPQIRSNSRDNHDFRSQIFSYYSTILKYIYKNQIRSIWILVVSISWFYSYLFKFIIDPKRIDFFSNCKKLFEVSKSFLIEVSKSFNCKMKFRSLFSQSKEMATKRKNWTPALSKVMNDLVTQGKITSLTSTNELRNLGIPGSPFEGITDHTLLGQLSKVRSIPTNQKISNYSYTIFRN